MWPVSLQRKYLPLRVDDLRWAYVARLRLPRRLAGTRVRRKRPPRQCARARDFVLPHFLRPIPLGFASVASTLEGIEIFKHCPLCFHVDLFVFEANGSPFAGIDGFSLEPRWPLAGTGFLATTASSARFAMSARWPAVRAFSAASIALSTTGVVLSGAAQAIFRPRFLRTTGVHSASRSGSSSEDERRSPRSGHVAIQTTGEIRLECETRGPVGVGQSGRP